MPDLNLYRRGLRADGGVPDGYPVVVANWERIRRFEDRRALSAASTVRASG